MHVAPLNVDGKKMSKSLDNFITIKKVLNEYHSEVLRVFFYLTHYRKPINFTKDSIIEAKNILDKIYESLRNFELIDIEIDENYKSKFEEALSDDFNTPKALKILQDLTQKINKADSAEKKYTLQTTLKSLANAIGLLSDTTESYFKYSGKEEISEEEIEALISKRNEARQNKDFETADSIRDDLLSKDIVLEDKNDKTFWKKR